MELSLASLGRGAIPNKKDNRKNSSKSLASLGRGAIPNESGEASCFAQYQSYLPFVSSQQLASPLSFQITAASSGTFLSR
jgi:hypothetical protein